MMIGLPSFRLASMPRTDVHVSLLRTPILRRMDESVHGLTPGYFALVMASGIVSIGALDQGLCGHFLGARHGGMFGLGHSHHLECDSVLSSSRCNRGRFPGPRSRIWLLYVGGGYLRLGQSTRRR